MKDASQFPNLTIKKIPKMVLNRCEWGRDDYSLEVKALPQAMPEPEPPPVPPSNGRKKVKEGSLDLFTTAAETGGYGQ
jgi:adenine-specific DNA-methyltransferase